MTDALVQLGGVPLMPMIPEATNRAKWFIVYKITKFLQRIVLSFDIRFNLIFDKGSVVRYPHDSNKRASAQGG